MDMDITNSSVLDTAVINHPKTAPPASEKQVNFIFKLMHERDMTPESLGADPNMMTKTVASQWIGTLLDMPKTKASVPEPDEGFYIVGGKVYKVQVAVHGSGKKYAKMLVPGTAYGDKGTWEYVGRKPFNLFNDSTKLTLEKAKELGHLYGMCCVCGATLTNESSIEAGIGPVCANKF